MKERKRNRMLGYDYSQDNLYFVTSCTQDRIHYFGQIYQGEMLLNEAGIIAQQQWQWLVDQYPYILSHAFVVMPNHIHGVLEINHHFVQTGRDLSVQNDDCDDDFIGPVGTGRDLSLLAIQNPIKIKSLSELMGAYKTTTSKQIHLAGNINFAWQRSFHDHIIRDDDSYYRIINYIHNNPKQWAKDRFKL